MGLGGRTAPCPHFNHQDVTRAGPRLRVGSTVLGSGGLVMGLVLLDGLGAAELFDLEWVAIKTAKAQETV